MAITPIDLQTLFTQLDKVGRTHASQRESQALQQAVQGIQLQRKTDEQIKQVNEAQNMGDGIERLNDQEQKQAGGGKKGRKQEEETEEDIKQEQRSVLRDPNLGKNIDISL